MSRRGQIVRIRGGGSGTEGLWAHGCGQIGSEDGLPHGEQDYVYAVWTDGPPEASSIGYDMTIVDTYGNSWPGEYEWPAGSRSRILMLTWDGVTPEAECSYVFPAYGSSESGILVHLIGEWNGAQRAQGPT